MQYKLLSYQKPSPLSMLSADADMVFRDTVSQDSREALLLSPIHLCNDLFYRQIQSLHSADGFITPASHYTHKLSACYAAYCFKESFLPWLEDFLNPTAPNTPFTFCEMGGGEGLLLEQFIEKFLRLIVNVCAEKDIEYLTLLPNIRVLLLDQSPSLLEKQKAIAKDQELTVVASEPIDLGSRHALDDIDWLKGVKHSVNFFYTCELLDDISGGQVVNIGPDRAYSYETLIFVTDHALEYFGSDDSLSKTSELIVDSYYPEIGYGRTSYVLNYTQARDYLMWCHDNKRTPQVELLTVQSPYTMSEATYPIKTQAPFVYINTFEPFKESLEWLSCPNTTMVHLDYFTIPHPEQVIFYPDSCGMDLDNSVIECITMLGRYRKLQQPTVHVSLAQSCLTLDAWSVQEISPNLFSDILTQIPIFSTDEALMDRDNPVCMPTHTFIASDFTRSHKELTKPVY